MKHVRIVLAILAVSVNPLEAQPDAATEERARLRAIATNCPPCADLFRQYEAAGKDIKSLEELPLGERDSEYDIALQLARVEEGSLVQEIDACARKNCPPRLTPLETPDLIPLSEKDEYNRTPPQSPVTAPTGETVPQVISTANGDLVAIRIQSASIRSEASGCGGFVCAEGSCSDARSVLQKLANLEALLDELLRALNEAEAAADAHHKSLVGTSGVTTANLANVRAAIIFHKTFHNIGSALLDLASILDFIQKAPEFLAGSDAEQLDSLYEALKDAESLINTIGTETGVLEKEINAIGGLATQPIDAAQSFGANVPVTEFIRNNINDLKSDASDLNELQQSIRKIKKALDEGQKAKDLIDDWKSVSRASGQFVGRILKRYSASVLAERQAELEAKTESLVAESGAVLAAYGELQTITDRQLAAQDALKEVREARQAMMGCLGGQCGGASFVRPEIPNFVDTYTQPGQPPITIYSWGRAFQYLNAQLPDLSSGINVASIGIVEGNCAGAEQPTGPASSDCPACDGLREVYHRAQRDLELLESLPPSGRDSDFDLTVQLAQNEVFRAGEALSECRAQHCPSDLSRLLQEQQRRRMGPRGTGTPLDPWAFLSQADARGTDCPPCIPIAYAINNIRDERLFLESERDRIRRNLEQADELRARRDAALRDAEALNRKLQSLGNSFEARVDRAALQGELLGLTSSIGRLNEEIKRLEAGSTDLEGIAARLEECDAIEARLLAELAQCELQCQTPPAFTFIGIVSSTPIIPGGDIFTPPGVEQIFGMAPPPPINLVADLGLTKIPSVPQVSPGGIMFFDLRGTNAGPDPAPDVVIIDTLPSGFIFQSFTASQGTCSFASPVLTCNVGALAPLANADIRINVMAGATATGTLTNTANIFSSIPDPSGGNNFASVPVNILPPPPPATADLGIIKTAGSNVAIPGGSLAYNFVASNAGPANATGVRVVDPVPPGLSFNNASVPQGTCQLIGNDVRCDLGGINSGGSVNFILNFNVAQSATGSIRNTAVISGDQTDPVGANNSSTATVTVQPPAPTQADLGITKTALSTTVQRGATVSYRITVTNGGPANATGVRVTDTVPDGMTLTEAAGAGTCTATGNPVQCDLGTIVSGGSAELNLTFRVAGDAAIGPRTNTVTVAADQSDPSSANNTASSVVTIDPPPLPVFEITKRDSADPVDAGVQFDYIIEVFNNSSVPARAFIVDALPPQLLYVGNECPRSGSVISCNPREVPAFGRITQTIQVRSLDDASGTVTNLANVTSDGVLGPGSRTEVSETTTIRPRQTSSCALGIDPGIYFGSGGSCGVSSDATVSCNSSSEFRFANPNLNLVCDQAGACGDNNIVFGQPNHRCTVFAQGTGFRIECEQLGTPNRCSQSFSPR